MGFFEKVFGTHSEKELKKITPLVDKIEALDSKMQALSDDELKAKTAEFKERLSKFVKKKQRKTADHPALKKK